MTVRYYCNGCNAPLNADRKYEVIVRSQPMKNVAFHLEPDLCEQCLAKLIERLRIFQ